MCVRLYLVKNGVLLIHSAFLIIDCSLVFVCQDCVDLAKCLEEAWE